jgi:hypothetical protein
LLEVVEDERKIGEKIIKKMIFGIFGNFCVKND